MVQSVCLHEFHKSSECIVMSIKCATACYIGKNYFKISILSEQDYTNVITNGRTTNQQHGFGEILGEFSDIIPIFRSKVYL